MLPALVASGLASWFQPYQAMYHGAYVCAMRDRRLIGSTVRIVVVLRHQSCTVIGYGPASWTGRVIDVSPLVRDDLGLREPGILRVRVYCIRRCP